VVGQGDDVTVVVVVGHVVRQRSHAAFLVTVGVAGHLLFGHGAVTVAVSRRKHCGSKQPGRGGGQCSRSTVTVAV
jgi:hypothetical protein